MNPNHSPFPKAWLSIELEGYREHPESTTYSSFSIDDLPPLPIELFCGDFEWLKESELYNAETEVEDLSSKIQRIESLASQIHLLLPKEFVNFMKSPNLQNRIRSCTDCYFDLSNELIESPNGDGNYLIRFLSDSQGCLFWYIYLIKTGEHCVIVSDELFDFDDEFESDDEEIESSDEEHYSFFCASSFEEFIYRFWIENEIWFALSYDNKPLTEMQQNYVNHYKKLLNNFSSN